jgi:hypothetical protein
MINGWGGRIRTYDYTDIYGNLFLRIA